MTCRLYGLLLMLPGDVRNAFELQVREHPPIILRTNTPEDKNNWMAALVSLLTRRYIPFYLLLFVQDDDGNRF